MIETVPPESSPLLSQAPVSTSLIFVFGDIAPGQKHNKASIRHIPPRGSDSKQGKGQEGICRQLLQKENDSAIDTSTCAIHSPLSPSPSTKNLPPGPGCFSNLKHVLSRLGLCNGIPPQLQATYSDHSPAAVNSLL
uniref:Uncharacterized protein n=1 Tax=Coccidioides posadasii RMSCC 3488 TaxID=454284 RepID=A0A0J6FFI6_COCPO|nr:hypothetical protein CPAG_04412 [Coccidioides posadasii RMSCC 3488]